MKSVSIARFDARLPKEQKDFFEYAASLGGFKTLTEFILYSAREKARAIVEEHDRILAGNKDQEVFFQAILNPPAPNDNLQKAAAKYKQKSK